jgi:hypothetical protein
VAFRQMIHLDILVYSLSNTMTLSYLIHRCIYCFAHLPIALFHGVMLLRHKVNTLYRCSRRVLKLESTFLTAMIIALVDVYSNHSLVL